MGAARGTTYVVVHGAGDTGASWELVAAELRTRGGELIAPDLPCEDDRAGWSEYADVVVRAAGDRRDLVVVGHSLGGFTAPLACSSWSPAWCRRRARPAWSGGRRRATTRRRPAATGRTTTPSTSTTCR